MVVFTRISAVIRGVAIVDGLDSGAAEGLRCAIHREAGWVFHVVNSSGDSAPAAPAAQPPPPARRPQLPHTSLVTAAKTSARSSRLAAVDRDRPLVARLRFA